MSHQRHMAWLGSSDLVGRPLDEAQVSAIAEYID